jgi:hypothetical protein
VPLSAKGYWAQLPFRDERLRVTTTRFCPLRSSRPEIKFIFGRGPSPEVRAAGPVTDESQLAEDCPGAFYAVRTAYGPPPKKAAAISESEAIANYQAIST